MIGVVDIGKVVVQYPLYSELNKQLEESATQRKQQLDLLEGEIEELRGTIQVIEPGDERDLKQMSLKLALQRHEFLVQMFNTRTRIEQDRVLLRVYQDIDVAIGRVARDKGVALVLRKLRIPPSETPIEELDPREVKARVDAFESRKLWFASDELDITGDVIKFLQVPLERSAAPAKAGAEKGEE